MKCGAMLKETKHFSYIYCEEDSDISDVLLNSLEDAFARLCDIFRFSESEWACPYSFYLCADVETFLRITGKHKEEYQPWMVGNSDAQRKQIAVLSPKAAEGCSLKYLQSVAIHELVHMVFDEVTKVGENEEWISEGIAILFSNQTDLRYVSEQECPLIAQLSGSDFADNGGYDYAGIYVWYFIRQYGFEEFLKAYKNQVNLSEKVVPGFERAAVREYRNMVNRV